MPGNEDEAVKKMNKTQFTLYIINIIITESPIYMSIYKLLLFITGSLYSPLSIMYRKFKPNLCVYI